MARTYSRTARTSSEEKHWKRNKRQVFIILLSAVVAALSSSQLFLSVLIFTYLPIPQCVLVGQSLALVSSILTFAKVIFFYFLARRLRSKEGARDRKSLLQSIFFTIHTTTTSLWWLACLNGAYIFGFNHTTIGCPPEAFTEILGRVTTPCQVYQVSLSASVPAFICSAFELALLLRCKQPFMNYRTIFRGPKPYNSDISAERPILEAKDSKLSLRSSPANSISASTCVASAPPSARNSLVESIPRDLPVPTRSQFRTCQLHRTCQNDVSIRFNLPNWDDPGTPQQTRTRASSVTLVDSYARRSSLVAPDATLPPSLPLPRFPQAPPLSLMRDCGPRRASGA